VFAKVECKIICKPPFTVIGFYFLLNIYSVKSSCDKPLSLSLSRFYFMPLSAFKQANDLDQLTVSVD
jgi:hypothetical protein